MKASFRKFLINHTLLTAFLAIIFFSLKFIFPAFPIPGSIVAIFVFFYLFVLLVHWILVKSSERRPQVFIRTFLVMTVAKLFIYLGFVSILILWNKSDAKGVIIAFAVLYFVNLAHEISAILNHLSSQEKTGENGRK